MKYTEYGLQIGLEELRKMLERAERECRNNSMEHCIYIRAATSLKSRNIVAMPSATQ